MCLFYDPSSNVKNTDESTESTEPSGSQIKNQIREGMLDGRLLLIVMILIICVISDLGQRGDRVKQDEKHNSGEMALCP